MEMNRFRCGIVLVFAALAASFGSGSAATLDDVMARLDSLQRDNQAMRNEIAALRQKEQRSAAAQTGDTRNAPSRQLSPATSSAMAADFPVKGHYVEPPQAFSWSGFYLGLHAGYGWGSNDWSHNSLFFDQFPVDTVGTLSPKTNGVLGGIQAGANLQRNNWVLGIEADLALMHADETARVPLPGFGDPGISVTARSQIDWLATFTGRVGYAFDRSLFYVKGGVAAAAFKDTFIFNQAPASLGLGTKETTRVGWTVGGGWEYAFAPNWSAKVEYNYLDFGTTAETFTAMGAGLALTSSLEIEHSLHIVKAGVNYRF